MPQGDVLQGDVPQSNVPQSDVPQGDVLQGDVPHAARGRNRRHPGLTGYGEGGREAPAHIIAVPGHGQRPREWRQQEVRVREDVLAAHNVNIWYLDQLLQTVPQDRLTHQPPGLPNHPLWIVGHLAWATDQSTFAKGATPVCPPAWTELFGRTSVPVSDPSRYPMLSDVREALHEGHRRVTDGYRAATDEVLGAPSSHPLLSSIAPNVGAMAIFGMMGHEAIHLGQFSAWRRACGEAAMF